MSKISTEDCRKFLVDFFTKNPSVVTSIFYSGSLSTGEQIARDELARWATNPKLWKRARKYKVQSPNSWISDDTIDIYDASTPVRRSGYDGTKNVNNTFVWAREFYLNEDQLENQVGFVVLEDEKGNLALGPYCGD